ncbi:MAG: hypothetical protein IKQ18_05190 [Clostridia bacterium]|nr:hypothetical protein [Clostridia bacterium]
MKKKFSPLMIAHLVLMLLVLIFSVFNMIKVFSYLGAGPANAAPTIIYGVCSVFNAAAMCAGILYLWNEYGKKAAILYKSFLYLNVVVTVLMLVVNILVDGQTALKIPAIVILGVKAVILLVMTFKKDLGKKNTWTLFLALLILDVAGVVLMFIGMDANLIIHEIHGAAARLINAGTIALAIRGKYADKDRRGTK